MIWWFISVIVYPFGYTYLFVDPSNYPIAGWIIFWYWIVIHWVWITDH